MSNDLRPETTVLSPTGHQKTGDVAVVSGGGGEVDAHTSNRNIRNIPGVGIDFSGGGWIALASILAVGLNAVIGAKTYEHVFRPRRIARRVENGGNGNGNGK